MLSTSLGTRSRLLRPQRPDVLRSVGAPNPDGLAPLGPVSYFQSLRARSRISWRSRSACCSTSRRYRSDSSRAFRAVSRSSLWRSLARRSSSSSARALAATARASGSRGVGSSLRPVEVAVASGAEGTIRKADAVCADVAGTLGAVEETLTANGGGLLGAVTWRVLGWKAAGAIRAVLGMVTATGFDGIGLLGAATVGGVYGLGV